MSGFDGDLEKAFTNGNPEAVLDFLVIRSRQALHKEQEEEVVASSVPVFSSDNDMAAFVRDLTIDDAISLCFADLPSDCEDSVTSSAPTLMPSRPERKLTDSARTAESDTAHTTLSSDIANQRSAVKPPPSPEYIARAVRGSSRGKPRGFLSSLLARGHKGRRGGSQRKASGYQSNASSKHSDPSGFSLEKEKEKPVVCQSAAHSRLRHGVPAPAPRAEGFDELGNVHPRQAVAGKLQRAEEHFEQVMCDTDPGSRTEYRFSPPNAKLLGAVEHRFEPDVQLHLKPTVNPSFQNGHAITEHVHNKAIENSNQLPSSALSSSNRSKGSNNVHPHVHGGLGLRSEQTQKSALDQQGGRKGNHPDKSHKEKKDKFPSLTLLKTFKCLTVGKDTEQPDVGSTESPELSVEETDQNLPSQKPWEGICEGVDAFIDFERDPNLEVPLDPHLSAQFAFERGPGDLQGDEELGEVTGENLHLVDRFETSNPPLQTPALASADRVLRPSEDEPETWMFKDSVCASSSQNISLCSPPSLPVPSRVSTSTQTEGQSLKLSERSSRPELVHCLQSAILQLSSLSPCSTCDDVIAKILVDLKDALLEAEEDKVASEKDAAVPRRKDSSGGDAARGHSQICSAEEQLDDALSDGVAAVTTSRDTLTHEADSAKSDEHWSNDYTTDVHRHRRPHTSHREAGFGSTFKASVSRRHPEQPAKRLKQSGAGKKHVTSKTSADSDSDGTSTVTSEAVTVLLCQRGNGSSSESSKTVRSHDKAISSARASRLDAAEGEKATASESPDSAPSSVRNADTGPASDRNARTTKNLASRSSVTGETNPLPRTTPRSLKYPRGSPRYAGEADRDYESFMTSSWSEMTSVSSVSDVITSADESSYYSGDDDNDDEDEEGEDAAAVVRLGLLDEDRDDAELRHHRLQRHLAAVLRQSSIPASTVETVVAATGERLNSQERHVNHVNQGALYPFSNGGPVPLASGRGAMASVPLPTPEAGQGSRAVTGLHASAAPAGREARTSRKSKKGAGPRLFSPERQVSLIAARQMTSEEFREGYDRSTDITKAKRSQLDGDIPWDLIPCSDTDDDAGSDKAWYNVSSEEESLAHAYGSDTDCSTTISDW